jgi:RNA polymerase sigma-70 factor (ECF subfamily)
MTTLTLNTQAGFDEATLVDRAKRDPAAFGALYDRHVARIYGYVMREVRNVEQAQDVTATTFEKALRNLHRFQMREIGFTPWLYRIARNEIAQSRRRERRWHPLDPEDEENTPTGWFVERMGEQRPVESTLVAGERNRSLYTALAQLDEADRELLTLRFIEQLPTGEVAQILECSRDNVYVRLHRALKRLRDRISATEEK